MEAATAAPPADNAYVNFINSIDSKDTKRNYKVDFGYFMDFIRINSHAGIAALDTATLESYIRDFIIHLKEERKLAPASIRTYIAAIAHFTDMNGILIHWKTLKKFMPRFKKTQDDKPYTREQIQQLLTKASPRERAIVLLMSSSGIRRGAVPVLRYGDLTVIPKPKIYRIRVYANESEEYVTYCTPEAKVAIDQYL